ncbi:AAA family ATPase [Deinococcus sedimenti]|uniref:AAA+ ATPase domain-containing protein n=1 Tax=Deinococcus sedimenti TaxID=1867090 RepID=A0ABQ2S6W7_9DEIO|nr:AAA family ATPase [Deinococcus sedimenti]GGR98375.1 hypothetical protein GCM10008960_26270 [Deinococcus sedimenti]
MTDTAPTLTLTPPSAPTVTTLGGLDLNGFRKVKSLLLLVYVALEGPTPRRQLATLLWPGAARPEGSLRVALHTLRETHPDALGGEERLTTSLTTDATHLLTLRGEAAWDAYPGPFLHGVPLQGVSTEFEDWVETQRERLARHVQVEALRAAEAAEPARAATWAERAYRTPAAPPPEADFLRRLLPHTLPTSPLEAEVRAELGELDADQPAPTRAPRVTARLLGREAELDALLAWTLTPGPDANGSVALITGPGGIGKSTLTRELLRELTRLDRPVTLVDAEGASSAAELSARLAAALTPGQAAPPTLTALADLIPPNAAVLIDGADALPDLPDLLGTLRRDLPALHWVVSSRRSPPGILRPSDLLLPLAGLAQAPPEADLAQIAASSATQLFLREAARTRRDLTLNAGNAALIAGITRRLQGHPLALALAASWLRVEHLDAVYARVLTEAAQLTPEGGDSDGRRGLTAVARRSWDLLTHEQQQAALRLSVTSDLDPADAPHLGVPAPLIDELLTHNFLETHQPGTERLRLYPALRGLLNEQAAAHPDLITQARADHAHHYLTWFTAQPPEAPPVDAERDNILAALHTALERGDATAAQMDHFLAHHDRRGLHASGTDTFATLADAAEDASAPESVQAAAQIASMWLAYRAGRLLDAQTLAGHFLAGPLATDPTSRMKVLNTLAAVRGSQGQLNQATELLEEALKLAIESEDSVRIVLYKLNIFVNQSFIGERARMESMIYDLKTISSDLNEAMTFEVNEKILHALISADYYDIIEVNAEADRILEYAIRSNNHSLEKRILLRKAQIYLYFGDFKSCLRAIETYRNKSSSEELFNDVEYYINAIKYYYSCGKSPRARKLIPRAIEAMDSKINPWEVIELLITIVMDIDEFNREKVMTWLNIAYYNQTIHFNQKLKIGRILGISEISGEERDPIRRLDHGAILRWLRELFKEHYGPR